MDNYDVIVEGFPSSMNTMKVKLFVEKGIGKGSVKKVERQEDGHICFTFMDLSALQRFIDVSFKTVTFGNETYMLSCRYSDAVAVAVSQIQRPPAESLQQQMRSFSPLMTPAPRVIAGNHDQFYHPSSHPVGLQNAGSTPSSGWQSRNVAPMKPSDSTDFYHRQNSPSQWNRNYDSPRKDSHWDPRYQQNMARDENSPQHRYNDRVMHPPSGTSMPLHGSNANATNVSTNPKQVIKSRKAGAKGHPGSSIEGEDEKSLYQTKHFWTDFKRLPSEGGTRCILAQNIDPTMHIQAVKMHFESNKRSGGGPVKSIIRMNDGLLIIFENENDCGSCATTRKQEIENQSLKIFTKIVPTFHERKFVIKGVSAHTSVDVLKMFLERCTEDEISPSFCKKQSIPGVYLIEYNDSEFDNVDTEDFLVKISADPLEDHRLQGLRLLHSDCLKVTGVPPTASDDEIRFVFESKRRTDGGPVTCIDRVKNGNVLVYFENFADAERTYNRFKQPSIEVILIRETTVTVELYYHSLSKEHEEVVERKISKPKPKLQQDDAVLQISGGLAGSPVEVQLRPSCDEKIFLLIKGSPNHHGALVQSVKDLGRVELYHSPTDGCLVKFTPDKKLSVQERYDERCKNRFQEFISQFVTKSASFDKGKLQKARSLKLHPMLHILQDKDLDKDLKVSWKGNGGTVEITGLKQQVEKMLAEIEGAVESNTVMVPIDEEGYRVMIHCGIIGELRHKYDKIKINCDDEKSVISITGPDRDVHQIQIEALSLRTMAKERKITDFDEFAVQYLLQNSKMAQKVIQDCISGSNIKAEFGFDSEDIYIRARNMGEHRKAMNIIRDMVALEILPVTGGRADVIKSNGWKRFQQEMSRNKSQGLYLRPDNSIVMVGMQADVRTLRTKVDTFLNENEIKKDYIQMVYGKAMFILHRSQQFTTTNPTRKAVKCGLTPEYGGGIFTEGMKPNLDAARREINKLSEGISEQRHTLRDPGIKNYYLGDEGKEFLETMSRVNNCVILLNSPLCEEWIRYEREHRNDLPVKGSGNSSMDSNENLVTVDRDGVKLAVWKIDIIKHHCDAIVNASNKELALLLGGVSGVIKQYDMKNANQIQMEMKAIADSNVGCLMPGDAALTGAGNLPNCKKIVHAVGPRWSDASERGNKPDLVLKSCIRKSLEVTETAKLQSLAVPAISCGVFGGVPNICVPLILDAVHDYFNDNKASCIKQVDFVELSNQAVLSEFKKGVLKIGKPIQTKPTKQSKQAKASISSSFLQSFAKLVQGDIALQNVDVIVNIMAEGHVQDICRGSAISKAIAAAGGQTVVNECAQHHGKLSAGSIFKTSSGSLACQEIYHGLLRNYDQTSENTVKRLVKKCLDMADRGRMKSIAFPAIGTGGFSFPPHDVAKWMKEVIGRFTPNSLTAVFIVLHQSNPAALSAFQAEFTSAAIAPPTATPVANVNLPSSVQYGPLTVSVIQGDITQQKCDAIVNSTNADFELSYGLVSTKILQQGGDGIQDEIDKGATGDFAVTTGGNLPCGHIIHMVTPRDSKDLQKKIVNLLQLADSKSFSSVAIPALGTGKLSMDSSTVGLHMRAAIEAFAKLNPKTLTVNKVDIVIFDSNMLQQFREAILGTVKKGTFQKLIEGVKEWFYPTAKEEKVVETLDLYLYAGSKQEIHQTLKCIDNETKKMMHRETIEDPTLEYLTAMENFEILEIEKKNNVKIEYISGRYLKHLVLVGLTKNVMKACDAIRSVLRELSEAETFVQYIAWEKQASNGVWVELPSRAAHSLEKAYQLSREKKGKLLTEVQVMEFRFNKIAPETYDLSTLGNDPKGSSPPKVRRRPKEKGESDALPSNWDDMQGNVLKQVPLQPGSAEYQKVLAHLQRTGLQPSNIVIARIQSVSLYKQYTAKKAEVTKKLQGTNCQIEMELFHGTTNADKIISNGFDRGFAGMNAAVYGNGVYFATQAAYSNSYTQPGPNGMRTMFLANVITGAFAQGSGGMRTPPVKSGLDLYDSVVDKIHGPTMYVIFKDASAYPTYLISYQ